MKPERLPNWKRKWFNSWTDHPIGWSLTHRIHVWDIDLHLPSIYAKCRQIFHTWILCYVLTIQNGSQKDFTIPKRSPSYTQNCQVLNLSFSRVKRLKSKWKRRWFFVWRVSFLPYNRGGSYTQFHGGFEIYTPETNMEPKNDGFSKESPLLGVHFQVPC